MTQDPIGLEVRSQKGRQIDSDGEVRRLMLSLRCEGLAQSLRLCFNLRLKIPSPTDIDKSEKIALEFCRMVYFLTINKHTKNILIKPYDYLAKLLFLA